MVTDVYAIDSINQALNLDRNMVRANAFTDMPFPLTPREAQLFTSLKPETKQALQKAEAEKMRTKIKQQTEEMYDKVDELRDEEYYYGSPSVEIPTYLATAKNDIKDRNAFLNKYASVKYQYKLA